MCSKKKEQRDWNRPLAIKKGDNETTKTKIEQKNNEKLKRKQIYKLKKRKRQNNGEMVLKESTIQKIKSKKEKNKKEENKQKLH